MWGAEGGRHSFGTAQRGTRVGCQACVDQAGGARLGAGIGLHALAALGYLKQTGCGGHRWRLFRVSSWVSHVNSPAFKPGGGNCLLPHQRLSDRSSFVRKRNKSELPALPLWVASNKNKQNHHCFIGTVNVSEADPGSLCRAGARQWKWCCEMKDVTGVPFVQGAILRNRNTQL